MVLLAGWYIYVSNLPAFSCNEKMLTDNEKEFLEIDDNVRAAVVVVCDTFSLGNKPLECINAYDNFVSFETLTAGVSLVYAVDGAKPKHISTPDESYNGKVYTKKLLSNWYFVCKTEI